VAGGDTVLSEDTLDVGGHTLLGALLIAFPLLHRVPVFLTHLFAHGTQLLRHRSCNPLSRVTIRVVRGDLSEVTRSPHGRPDAFHLRVDDGAVGNLDLPVLI